MIAWPFGKKKVESKGKDDFVSLSSHELRSPLSIIKWYTEILLDEDAGPLNDDQKKYLSIIEESNERAISLVRSLLNVSRLELGTFSVLPEKITLRTIIEQVILSLKELSIKKDIKINFERGDDDTDIMLDPKLASIVIKSIILNSIFFSNKGGSVKIGVIPVKSGQRVDLYTSTLSGFIVFVSDNGKGVPEIDSPKIFSKMFKARNVTEENGSGSGLSLYISKYIMNYIGGDIWFSSKENMGSTFYILFPKSGMKKKIGKTTLD